MKSSNALAILLASVGVAVSSGALAAAPGLSTQVVVGKLELPWDMAFLKDGTMFFTEKCKGLSVRLASGAINKLHGLGESSGYASTSADLFCDGQAGMMGVAVDPEFSSNRYIYVYSSSNLNDKLSNRVMRFKVDESFSRVSDRTDIVSDIGYKPKATKHPFGGPGAHNGGRIRFSPGDGFLYVTTGDNHLGIAPQSPTYIGGKVLRIDRDGKAAPGNNPPAGFDRRVFTYGHRNPQGITFRPGDNRPFTSENGPWHSDEVTALVNGGNAGWDPRPNVGGRNDCPDDYCGYSPNQMGAMDPKLRAAFMPMTDLKTYPNAMKPAWNNNGLSQGMFGSTFVSGAKWKDWDGALIVGYTGIGIHGTPVGNRLDVLTVSADGLSAKATPVSWPTATGRFRSVVQGPDGDLYVALEDQGNIIRVTPE
ncbi:MAG: PQQ-dependent sugar dehydrogenase [Burkholderiales bacterium]|nr:PQQ-dependent sugar dehydrogenase [Burkholderiales bacterium]